MLNMTLMKIEDDKETLVVQVLHAAVAKKYSAASDTEIAAAIWAHRPDLEQLALRKAAASTNRPVQLTEADV